MKKKVFIISTAIVTGFFTAQAQENKVVSAKMHLDEFTKDGDTSALHDAKDAIDLAANNDKTKDEPKTLLYRGNVYRTYYDFQRNTFEAKEMKLKGKPANKDSLMKLKGNAYATIDTTALCVATNSYMRVIQLVPKDYYADESRQMLVICELNLENKARADYGHKKYASALAMFEKAITVGKFMGLKDTSEEMIGNVQNAAVTAAKIPNYPKAAQYYQMLIDMKVDGAQPYSELVLLYNSMKDHADSLKAAEVLKKGRAAYPGDVTLLISETNYYLQSHDNDKAIGNLQAAINKLAGDNKPENKTLLANLYFVLGNTYDRLANPKNDSNIYLAKPANYEDLIAKAEDNYTKALNLTPDNVDMVFDMGALYYERASYINQQANDLPVDATDKFNKLQAEANTYFKKAQPWLEKAHTLNPKDQATVQALIGIYASTGQTDKIKPLKEGK